MIDILKTFINTYMKLLIDLSSGGIDPLKLFFAIFLKITEQDHKSLTCQKLKA